LVGGQNCRVAVEDSDIDDKFLGAEIYPNPATQSFVVNLPKTKEGSTVIQLFDCQGKMLKEITEMVPQIRTVELLNVAKS
jgi:hypothetical protein